VRRGVNFNTPGRFFPLSGARSPAVPARELFTRNQSVLGGARDGSIIRGRVSGDSENTAKTRKKGPIIRGRVCTHKTCVFAPLARNSRERRDTRAATRTTDAASSVVYYYYPRACVRACTDACVRACMDACTQMCAHATREQHAMSVTARGLRRQVTLAGIFRLARLGSRIS